MGLDQFGVGFCRISDFIQSGVVDMMAGFAGPIWEHPGSENEYYEISKVFGQE